MKKLIFLISTAGKSSKQIKKEVNQAYKKYKKMKQQMESGRLNALKNK